MRHDRSSGWSWLRRAAVALSFLMLGLSTAGAQARGVTSLLLDPVDESRDRTVPIKVYLPESSEPRPVIVFSHGLGGSRENSVYLAEHWASDGFVCVFVQHVGSDESVWRDAPLRDRMAALRRAAGVEAFADRVRDIPFVLDRLHVWNDDADHELHGRMDLDHIGMCGHSFGAVTTQAMMGQKYALNRSFGEDRFDAFFAMSPSPGRGLAPERAFAGVDRPVLLMTGTRDESPIQDDVTPESRREVYQALPPGDKYELVLDGAEHMAFSDRTLLGRRQREPRYHEAILEISTRFWRAYLRDDVDARRWLQGEEPRELLVEADVWEHK